VGNPVRQPFWDFDRPALRAAGLARYGLDGDVPVVGVFGGSLGSGVINTAVAEMVSSWGGAPIAVVHLTGENHLEEMLSHDPDGDVHWHRLGFEDRMDLFYAVSDLVVARSGGAVAELTATATPSVLIPGQFGSGGHQTRNAMALHDIGAAIVVREESIGELTGVVSELLQDGRQLAAMAESTRAIAKPDAALTIARTMIEAVT
jgi:UDP-N-acetylglucosamine--N-acetylmuramyl-(pentapeptide) pyrophosphoryl-undecaprenol N-acetylglucosamine transferase